MRSLLTILTLILVFSTLALAGDPPLPVIAGSELGRPLLNQYKKQIAKRVAFRKQQVLDAADDATCVKARKLCGRDYEFYPDAYYQEEFAKQIAIQWMDMLTAEAAEGDAMNRIRQINTALAMSEMGVPTMQPGWEKLVRNDQPVFRSLGWLGYSRGRTALLKKGQKKAIDTLVASMKAGLGTETSPIVLQNIFLVLSPNEMPSMTDGTQKQFVNALIANWDTLRLGLLSDPQIDRFEALTGAALALEALNKSSALSTPKDKAKLSQMAIDLMQSASKVYNDNTETIATDKAFQAAIHTLLMQCEKSLQATSGKTDKKIQTALTSNDTLVRADRAAAIMGAVFEWADGLKSQGVTEPKSPKKPVNKTAKKPAKKTPAKTPKTK
jgi:hypothetical protein